MVKLQSSNQAEFYGYLKGAGINANQTFHLTGYGDYTVSRIDILKNPLNETHNLAVEDLNETVVLSQNPQESHTIELFAETSTNKIVEKLNKTKEEMIIEENTHPKEKANNNIEFEEEKIEEENYEEGQSDLSYEENEEIAKNMGEEKFFP